MRHEDGARAIDSYLKDNPEETGKLKNRKEVYEIMHSYVSEITLEKNNVPPTDICWNSVNNKPGTRIFDDFEHWPHALVYEDGMFRLVGTDYVYSGVVMHAGWKRPFGIWEGGSFSRVDDSFSLSDATFGNLPNSIVLRRDDLANGLRTVLKNEPVSVNALMNAVNVSVNDLSLCGICVEEETYKIYNISPEWANQTSYFCEEAKDGTWYYYLETIDECIGEVQRLIQSVSKLNSKSSN